MKTFSMPSLNSEKRAHSKRSIYPYLRRIGKRLRLPLDSGFKRVASSLNFHQLLGRDPRDVSAGGER